MVRALKLLIFVVCAAGLAKVEFGNDPDDFYAPSQLLESGEQKLMDVLGDIETHDFELVDLENWQRENFALRSNLYATDREPSFLTAHDLPSWMTLQRNGRDYVMLPCENGISVKGKLKELFNALALETYRVLVISSLVLVVAIFVLFGNKALSYAVPIVASICASIGVLGWLGIKVNFFCALCFFILCGIGMDYVIFHHSKHKEEKPVVLFSFLTSLVGFGMLSFTSFPVTRSMGITLAIGLFCVYVFSLKVSENDVKDEIWYRQKEQSAGKLRITLMWLIYRVFGKSVAKILFFPAWLFIYPFCYAAKKALAEYYAVAGVKPRPFWHLLSFAWALFDKVDACTLCKNAPEFEVEGDSGWMDGGAFLLSTHLGTIEVLPALSKYAASARVPKVHAFQQLGHNDIFTQRFLKKLNIDKMSLHAVEDIGVETAVEMREAISNGDLVLMAGDRLSAGSRSTLTAEFFNRTCAWPKGVFTFAKLMESPVYAIVCVQIGWNRYKVAARKLDAKNLLKEYAEFLEVYAKRYPYQWFQFYSFFNKEH